VSAGAPHQVDPDSARRAAHDIVESRRFRPEEVPKPLEGVLRWLGDRLEPIGRLLDPIIDFFSQGLGRILFVALLLAGVAFVAYRLSRTRIGRATHDRSARKARGETSLDPDELERGAAAAEARGDLDLAIRLRFRAGLLRLDRIGAIRFRPSITSSQVARSLRSRDFEELAASFDAVAYGGQPAEPADLEDARDRWPRVLTEARRP
jgi:Domain of unknown function (DUF4129)